MNLKKLVIERNLWGEDKGQYKGVISFDAPGGDMSLVLTPDMVRSCNKFDL